MRSIYRRDFVAWAAVASSFIAPSILGAQPRLEKSRVLIAIDGRSDIPLLPLTIADRLGYFRAEGLDVEMVDFSSASSALQALVSGSVQIGAGGYEQILGTAVRGHFLQSFVLLGRLPAIVMGVSTRHLPHFKTVADLKEKKVGVGAFGSASHAIAHRVTQQAGLALTDVNWVHLDNATEALSIFHSHQIDALSYGDPVMTQLEHKRLVHLVADSRTSEGAQALFGGLLPAACLYTHGAFLQQNPLTVQAMATAVVRALKWLQTAGPSDMMKVIPESFMLGDRALYLTAINKGREAVSPDGMMPKEGPTFAYGLFNKLKSATDVVRIDLGKTYTNDFVRIANAHLKT
jgi:NitT/TauT family transport system substrate-binding protein